MQRVPDGVRGGEVRDRDHRPELIARRERALGEPHAGVQPRERLVQRADSAARRPRRPPARSREGLGQVGVRGAQQVEADHAGAPRDANASGASTWNATLVSAHSVSW